MPGNSPSIKGAMVKAQAGDIILVSCGTYHEADIQVKSGVSLWSGTLQPDCVTIDAQGKGRCLVFSNTDSTTSIVGITLRGGIADEQALGRSNGGAVLLQSSSPRITRCVFSANSAANGGALAAVGASKPRLEQCRFEGNHADNRGGGIYWQGSGGTLTNCTLTANDAQIAGGALACDSARISIRGCLLQDNCAGNIGGAISLNRTAAIMHKTIIAHNSGGLAGGALAITGGAPILQQCTIEANTADGQGSVLRLLQSNPTLDRCLITGSEGLLLDATDSQPLFRQTNIFSPVSNGWPAGLKVQQAIRGNLSADPRYCEPAVGDYHLQESSPCLATEKEPPIGALGEGCGARFPTDVIE